MGFQHLGRYQLFQTTATGRTDQSVVTGKHQQGGRSPLRRRGPNMWRVVRHATDQSGRYPAVNQGVVDIRCHRHWSCVKCSGCRPLDKVRSGAQRIRSATNWRSGHVKLSAKAGEDKTKASTIDGACATKAAATLRPTMSPVVVRAHRKAFGQQGLGQGFVAPSMFAQAMHHRHTSTGGRL